MLLVEDVLLADGVLLAEDGLVWAAVMGASGLLQAAKPSAIATAAVTTTVRAGVERFMSMLAFL